MAAGTGDGGTAGREVETSRMGVIEADRAALLRARSSTLAQYTRYTSSRSSPLSEETQSEKLCASRPEKYGITLTASTQRVRGRSQGHMLVHRPSRGDQIVSATIRAFAKTHARSCPPSLWPRA